MTGPMSHDELSELVAVYALDAVEPDEARLVEEHLTACPRCRAELAEHREVTALLAHTGAPAPDGVWDRIAGSLDETPPQLAMGDVLAFTPGRSASGSTSGHRMARMAWALGAAAALVIALLGVQVLRQDQQLSDLRDQVQAAGVDADVDRALRDPDAELLELASPSGELRVRVVLEGEGRGYLLAHNLPELGPDKTYQLWAVGATEQPVSLAVLGRDPTTVPFTMSGPVTALAISAEDAPGVVVSEQEPVVVGETA